MSVTPNLCCDKTKNRGTYTPVTGPFERGLHYIHCLHHSLASGQTTGREHSPTLQQKIGLKMYWALPHPSEQDPVSSSVSPIRKLLILIHQRVSIMKTTITEKLITLITWTTALSNLIKLWAMLCRATQDGYVMVESSDKMWSAGEGNGKPLQYSCLENPKNSMKRKNDRILKEELPRSVGAQYATGDQWRNDSRKNEGMEPKQK